MTVLTLTVEWLVYCWQKKLRNAHFSLLTKKKSLLFVQKVCFLKQQYELHLVVGEIGTSNVTKWWSMKSTEWMWLFNNLLKLKLYVMETIPSLAALTFPSNTLSHVYCLALECLTLHTSTTRNCERTCDKVADDCKRGSSEVLSHVKFVVQFKSPPIKTYSLCSDCVYCLRDCLIRTTRQVIKTKHILFFHDKRQ